MKSTRILLAAMLLTLPAIAQTVSLKGRVTDESSAIVPGATVTLSGPGGLTKGAVSGNDGSYLFADLPPGAYTVRASAPGLILRQAGKITVQTGSQVLNLQLNVAAEKQEVTVEESGAPTVSTDAASNASATVLRRAEAAQPGRSSSKLQDPLQLADTHLKEATRGSFGLTFEERTRWEEKTGVSFGKAVDQRDMLSRLRVGAQFEPVDWFRMSAMGQDSRVPWYGVPAPNTLRDTMDLQEAYLEFFGDRKAGFGASFGRQMINYGEARLIGVPQWSNVSRTFDNGRVYYRTAKARLEVLIVSPVKILPDQFNRPDLGERIWGTYDTFSGVWHGASVDAYALRHSQNRIGGWMDSGTLGTNSFGGRLYGPLPHRFTYSLEAIGQTGHLGLRTQRAHAWYSGVSRTLTALKWPLTLSLEYKLASGTKWGAPNSSTFDQLSPANHDKFGHQDLFGWRNLKTVRTLETLNLTRSLAWNLMYSDHRLFSASDALYNSQGTAVALSKKSNADAHVGQELDSFITYKRGAHLFGAGFSQFFQGEYIAATTSHINPRYFYVFQQYSIKEPLPNRAKAGRKRLEYCRPHARPREQRWTSGGNAFDTKDCVINVSPGNHQ